MKNTIRFTFERETKGAVRYAEETSNSLAEPSIGTLYIRKSTLAAAGHKVAPTVLNVTVEAAQ